MRKLPMAVLGAFVLPVGLMPTAALAATDDPSPTITTPAEVPSSPSDPAPSVSVSVPEPSESASVPVDDGGDALSGTYTQSPSSGPAGTKISLTSKTSCVDKDGKVGPLAEAVLIDEAAISDDNDLVATAFQDVRTSAKGAWSASLTVPKKAKAGDTFITIAACFAAGQNPADADSVPFLIYEPQEFTVTGLPSAPVGKPVPGNPTFTG